MPNDPTVNNLSPTLESWGKQKNVAVLPVTELVLWEGSIV